MTDRRSFLKMTGSAAALAATGFVCPKCMGGTEPIRLKKLGTFDISIVEANPIVFGGKPWLMEYIRWVHKYRFNDTGDSYFRFLDLTDMRTVSAPFGHGLHMGNAFVAGGKIVVTAVAGWGKGQFYQLESTDMVHWSKPRVILQDPSWRGYNTTMCKAGDRYVLSFELGAPKEIVGKGFTMFFAESTDLKAWKFIEGARMGEDRYTGAPMLRHHGGWFYHFHLEGDPRQGYTTRVARSRDLKAWEFSPHVVIGYDAQDRRIHPTPTVAFSESEKSFIASAQDINASDLDMCEWNGKLLCFYSWGNQKGVEFSALAEAKCTEREFCESFFD